MIPNQITKLAFAGTLLSVSLAACTMPFRNPLLDPDTAAFDGIATVLRRGDAVDVISIHGMCTHGTSGSDRRF